MADTTPLFDVTPIRAPEKLVGAARRRQRQEECVARRLHPLTAALRVDIRLHPDAAPAGDRNARGLRCGSCVHRVYPNREISGRFPKCDFGGRWERASAGPGTDVKAHWSACVDYEAVDRG